MNNAVIYNRESQKVINLFGQPNREKYSLAFLTLDPSPENPGASYNLQIADLSSCQIE